MENFMNYLSNIISSELVLSVVAILFSLWSSKKLEKEKQNNRIQIERINNEFQFELDRLKSLNEKAIHVSNAQYDKEVEIYGIIWEKIYPLIIFTEGLYSKHDNEEFEIRKSRYFEFLDKFNEFSLIIHKFAPFYKENFYNEFTNIRDNCLILGERYRKSNFDVPSDKTTQEIISNKIQQLNKNRESLIKEIREYLSTLKII